MTGFECCGEYCACRTDGATGTSICEECNADGDCASYISNAFGDLRVMDETCDEGETCQNYEFEPINIEGENPEPEDTISGEKPEASTGPENTSAAQNNSGQPETNAPDDNKPSAQKAAAPEPDVLNVAGPDLTDPNAGGNGQKSGPDTPDNSPATKSDPVLLADGSLLVEQTDLSFPGPKRDLRFARAYNSRSEARGVLGSTADGDGVLSQADSNGGALVSVESRSTDFEYEPIFNEVIRSVSSITEAQVAAPTPLYETIYDYDHWDAASPAYLDGTAGVLTSLTRKSLAASAPDRTFSFTWTPNGTLASSTTPQGKKTSYS